MKEKAERRHTSSTLVLLAALNEEEGIYYTLRELRRYLKGSKLLVVDGYSK